MVKTLVIYMYVAKLKFCSVKVNNEMCVDGLASVLMIIHPIAML